MKANCKHILLYLTALLCTLTAQAVSPEGNLESTIKRLNSELKAMEANADKELSSIQESRIEFWKHIGQLQKDIDKAVIVLYSQDGGSLFSVGLASEELYNVCANFNREKIPFERWLQAMSVASNRHNILKSALEKVHRENLNAETNDYVDHSIAICDTLDRRFAAMRDSIALDKARYEKISKEIGEIENINKEVVNIIRKEIFYDTDEDLFMYLNSLDFQGQDFMYDESETDILIDDEKKDLKAQVDEWDDKALLIAIITTIIVCLAMRFLLPKTSVFRIKRHYYAFLVFILTQLMSSWLMPFFMNFNSYVFRVQGMFIDYYWFVFFVVLSATLRLRKPALRWSVLSYIPMMLVSVIIIAFATMSTRTSMLKSFVPVILTIFSVFVILILIFGARKIKKSDYATSFSCMGMVILSTILTFTGYYYLAIILLLFSMNVMTYLSAFTSIKIIFRKRLAKAGKCTKLTLTHLIYPCFYIYAFESSLRIVANTFNLNSWLSDQLSTPFIDVPQFGIVSISRILFLIALAVLVNYLIKLIKLMLMRTYRDKYNTGNMAVAVSLGTICMWICYLLTALMVLRINHSGVVAAIGGASLGLGFAMKDTFENFFSGLSLMAGRARPGDIVECDGARGIITKIGIMTTLVQIEDGPIVSFPNRQLFTKNFTNLTLNNRREIRHIIFDISDKSDIVKAKDLMLQAAEGIDGVVDHDKHYVVMKHTSCGIVRLDYKCWIDSSRYLRTEPAVREAIFNAFKANGIEIATFPQELDMRASHKILDGKNIY